MKRLVVFAVALLVTAPLGTQAASDSKDEAGRKQKAQRAGQARPAASPAPKTIDARAEGDDREPKTLGAGPGGRGPRTRQKYVPGKTPIEKVTAKPRELKMKRAPGRADTFDLRSLPYVPQTQRQRRELPDPLMLFPPQAAKDAPSAEPEASPGLVPVPRPPAPAPLLVFEGLDRFNWGAGSPPDTNGDVGPSHYIQTVNTSIGVYRKTDGFQLAAFTFNTFMSQGAFGNLCDTDNFGDPVVLYDTFEDRWVITDFAFKTDVSGNVLSPAFQCLAVSKNGDPVSGGWNFYSITTAGGLGDYPKFGIWPDGVYMTTSIFSFGAGSTFINARAYAFNKAQMYAGAPTVQVVSFDIGGGDFTILPSNARLQTGTPPAGRPNLYVSSWLFTNALTVYKFHVDWDKISLSTFTGPDVPIAATSWPNAAVANAPQPGTATLLDVLQIRAMVQNQYTNFGGTESLWLPHTVRRANTTGFAAPRWYQVNVTGGTVAAAIPQAATWDPDGANTNHRFMPSLALDRAGDLALGYSMSNATTVFPSMLYAGRLAGDPVNTFSKTEQTMFTGTASQTGTTRWGDYSSMTLDPDGCTFWYTNEYANPADQTFNHRWLTKVGAFKYDECTTVGAGGTLSGTVTAAAGGAPLSGVTVALGARSTTTDGAGFYSFTSLPAGTYPALQASKPGYNTASAATIVITDGNTTTQDFALTAAPASACLTDTTQSDFLSGVGTSVDVNTSPGDVTLSNTPTVDQQNTAGTTTGTGFGTPNWTGQSFIPAVTGLLAKADVTLFCNGCGATPPNLTLSVRNTAAGLPTGADLASVTIPGSAFASGASVTFTATFGAPATLTSGTQYALILRPVSVPAGSGYFWIRSSPSTYANGSRVLSADSGGTWSADTTRDYNFKAYMQTGYSASGNLVSAVKDANPTGGITPIWSTFSWNASVPANTSIQFQLAGSNNAGGPFNLVGPDGTAATFFTTSPVQLQPQFYNLRYLKYKAFLATTDGAVTPTLNDATFCFNDVDCSSTSATITADASVCFNSTGNTASGPAGMTAYAWGVTNGTITSATNTQSITYTAGASGNVGLSLNVVSAASCQASGSTNVPIVEVATPTITPGGPTTFCDGGSVTLTSSSASGNQWYLDGNPIGGATNQSYAATASGNYTVQVTSGSCTSAFSAATTVTVNPLPATPTITPGGPTTFCAGGSVTLTSSSASGNQWYLDGNPIGGETGPQYVATASGNYTVVVTDGNSCSSAASAATTVTVNPIPPTPTITPGGPTTFCAGGSVTLTSSSASGNQWYLDGNPIGGATNQSYVATASGNYTVLVTTNGCTSAASAATVVTVNPAPPTPTITPGGPTTFCAGGSVTLTSSSASGNQWYLDGNPIGGATNQSYVATASGDYTVQVNNGTCTSAASAATSVTVNPVPPTPTITPGGPTTFCAGGSVTLTSSSASGNQWLLNGNPIGGATNPSYVATASGNYTVQVTTSGCTSAASAATVVTVNPVPPTPTITPGGPTTFCAGGSVTLTSSSASGNQWLLNGNPIGGATNPSYVATASGNYTVQATSSGCTSAASATTTVTVNPQPNATISAPSSLASGASGSASVADAGVGATYAWGITNGTITGGSGTRTINFTAGAVGTLTLNVTVTTAAGCSDAKSANVTVTAGGGGPSITITPSKGLWLGGTAVTIRSTGFTFLKGATVLIGGAAAKNVIVVNGTTISATSPAHAAGVVDVKVTNPGGASVTLVGGFTYVTQSF